MFSDKVAKLRKGAGLTQKQFAEKLGVSIDSVRRWEQNKRSPDVNILNKIARTLNTTVAYIIEDDESDMGQISIDTGANSKTKQIDDASFIKEGDFIGSGRVLFFKDDNGKSFVLPATEENQVWFRDFMTKAIIGNTTLSLP